MNLKAKIAIRSSKIIVMLLLSMVFMGVNECSQQANMNMRHIGNFFSYPFRALHREINGTTDSAINDRFSRYVEQAGSTSLASDADVRCGARVPASVLDGVENVLNVGRTVLDQNCQCRAWDTPVANCPANGPCCNVNVCPSEVRCPLLCPNNTHILKNNKRRAAPVESEGNYFSFLNSAFDVFPNEARTPGRFDVQSSIPPTAYNLGMISGRRKFNELATFISGNGNVPVFPGDTQRDRDQRKKEYYQELVDRIFEGKPADIPGYRNLAEFSADPLIQRYLKQKIHDEWSDKSIDNNPFGETTANPASHMTRERGNRLVDDVTQGIEQMGSATVIFGYVSNSTDEVPAQALEAYRIFEQDGNKVICVHDPNLPASTVNLGAGVTAPSLHMPFMDPPKDCFPKMVVRADGSTTYKAKVREYLETPVQVTDEDGIVTTQRYRDQLVDRPLYDVRHFKTADRRDAVTEIPHLHRKCTEEKGCSNGN